MTVQLFPTHPRLSEPVPHPRGWVILGAMVASWLLFVGIAASAVALVGWLV
jgi:hypothetical protein